MRAKNRKFHLLSADGRRSKRTNRKTNSLETERERIDGRHDSRNGFENGRNNQVNKRQVAFTTNKENSFEPKKFKRVSSGCGGGEPAEP